MAITLDTSIDIDGSGASDTQSITIAADANFLVIGAGGYNSAGGAARTITGITIGGQAMTLGDRLTLDLGGGFYSDTGYWWKASPLTGAQNIVTTFSGSMDGIYGNASSLKGASTTGQPDATAKNDGTICTNPYSTSITVVAANSWIFDIITPSGGTLGAAGAGQTESRVAMTSYKQNVSAGSNSMSWAFPDCNAGQHVLISIAPGAGGGGSSTTATYRMLQVF